MIVFTQVLPYPVANALAPISEEWSEDAGKKDKDGDSETIYDLVVLVVDSNLDSDLTPLAGLTQDYDGLQELSLSGRIDRYADDIVENNALTDVKFVFFDKEEDSVEDLAMALETLYFDGEQTGGHVSKLAGAVFVGDIALPVVNDGGEKKVSMFPYTDFENRLYVFEGGEYVRDSQVTFPQAEVWHGVIKPDDNSYESLDELAAYFDKNHLYYRDDANFSKFEKKLFFGDLVAEKKKLNESLFGQ